jgi:Secretion system C-terminal sorting domain
MNASVARQYQLEKQWPAKTRGGGGNLSLPFFDDFSRNTLPTNDPDIPAEWQRWEDANVFLNTTFPVDPPTIGVATFDGLAGDGYPYDFTCPDCWGSADTLTSLPINLAGLGSDDNVALSFFYEAGGYGNMPDEEDSLILQFYSPFGEGQWFRVWGTAGIFPSSFTQVILPVTGTEYLLDGFKFRFINYATLSGCVDHWHIDYVLMDQNFSYTECQVDEVAMVYAPNTLLQEYTAMPWTHFISDPDSFMGTQVVAKETNLGPTENIVTGFRQRYEDTVWDFPNLDFNTFGNACSSFDRNLSLEGATYDEEVNDTCAIFDVSVYVTTTDGHPENDTASFSQVFYNYYAFDDGTAERAYALNVAGGKVAMKFFAEEPDSLLGLFIHWLPFQYDNSNKSFLLRVWGEGGGEPGSELAENYQFHYPHYYHDGYNIFSYYEYDAPVLVNGNFYVGWVQDTNTELNVGNDKNTNRNPTNLFYQLGAGGDWTQSEITGTVMIRPVFKSGKTNVWNDIVEFDPQSLMVYPNPATDLLTIEIPTSGMSLTVTDMSGRVVEQIAAADLVQQLDLSGYAVGMYILKATSAEGQFLTARFTKR